MDIQGRGTQKAKASDECASKTQGSYIALEYSTPPRLGERVNENTGETGQIEQQRGIPSGFLVPTAKDGEPEASRKG